MTLTINPSSYVQLLAVYQPKVIERNNFDYSSLQLAFNQYLWSSFYELASNFDNFVFPCLI